MKPQYYVYLYLDPRKPGIFIYKNYNFNFEPFYVGKGHRNRLYAHLKYKDESYKTRKINKILNEGYTKKQLKEKYVIKYKINLLECQAFKLEMDMIKTIGRLNLGTGPLTNLTDGGDGTSGYKHTKEAKEKISSFLKTREISDETKWKMGKSFRGKSSPFKGKHHTQKNKNKLRNEVIGKIWIYNDNLQKCKMINKEELNKYMKENWKKGRIYPNKQKKRRKF